MIFVEINDVELINLDLGLCYLIGLKGFSLECFKEYSVDEIIEITNTIHQRNSKIFVDITKICHDKDLPILKDLINKLGCVDGFFYQDFGLINYIDKEKRVFYNPTFVTNLEDYKILACNNKYVLVSPQLSYKELTMFNEESKALIIAFGTWVIFNSRRKLLTNYFLYKNQEYQSGLYKIREETRDNLYPIIERDTTRIYHDGIYQIDKELLNLPQNILIKTFNLDLVNTIKVIKAYKLALDNKDFSLFDFDFKTNKGLLYEESILKKEVIR